MAAENHETSNGWPLGLQIMTMRLGLQEIYHGAAPAVPPSSFSSFSSSNLDTESSASFFQDSSVSLGKLIGRGAGDRGPLYLQNTVHTHQSNRQLPVKRSEYPLQRGQRSRGQFGLLFSQAKGVDVCILPFVPESDGLTF
ncbi:uncharacterized protein LOC120190542 [Hibiscus syriacus]|uniref:uncharacterized protein LOC120190542 n=1 Tax=Hibiscus syriacus TaxID=106335 RepID=UPI0019217BA2|nr:uncharacterized protein LOC120190542 [Hibiscus syriacus]